LTQVNHGCANEGKAALRRGQNRPDINKIYSGGTSGKENRFNRNKNAAGLDSVKSAKAATALRFTRLFHTG
jgi:hypothetical protein